MFGKEFVLALSVLCYSYCVGSETANTSSYKSSCLCVARKEMRDEEGREQGLYKYLLI